MNALEQRIAELESRLTYVERSCKHCIERKEREAGEAFQQALAAKARAEQEALEAKQPVPRMTRLTSTTKGMRMMHFGRVLGEHGRCTGWQIIIPEGNSAVYATKEVNAYLEREALELAEGVTAGDFRSDPNLAAMIADGRIVLSSVPVAEARQIAKQMHQAVYYGSPGY